MSAFHPVHFDGKSHPMTVITPIPVRWRWLQWLVIEVFRRLPLGVVRQLAFIHFARWIVVRRDRLPRLAAEQPKEKLDNDLYLFITNFNGPWDQYIDAFGRVTDVEKGLDWLWWSSAGFPGAWPIRPFKRYIRYFKHPLDLYYNAYPGASVRDIAAAIELERRFAAFVASDAGTLPPGAFGQRWRAFCNDIAPFLGAIRGEPDEPESCQGTPPLGLQH
ncbi:MAG TPA: hypothetical protein VFL14_07490 [Xanthomonadales bacterium]|nr:hypothetical protein [Xanthomonadales bacterium]